MSVAVQHEQSARDRVVTAARHLFATRGFHRTAMADLAQESKVSVGAIYRSFAGKADIILAIVLDDTERMMSELQAVLDQVRRGDTTVQTAIETIVKRQFVGDDEALSHEILAEGHRNPAVAQQISEFCGRYRILFRELASVANSSLAGVELDGAEEVLMACTFGLGHRKLSQARLSEAATADIAARILLRALGGAPAIFVHN